LGLELPPLERVRRLRRLVQQIEYDGQEGQINITLQAGGWDSLAECLQENLS